MQGRLAVAEGEGQMTLLQSESCGACTSKGHKSACTEVTKALTPAQQRLYNTSLPVQPGQAAVAIWVT